MFDIAREQEWPARYSGRALTNAFSRRWAGHDDVLADDRQARAQFQRDHATGDLSSKPVWASDAVDLVTEVRPAADIVTDLVRRASACLAQGAERLVCRGSEPGTI